jgi:hypothetical protein
MLSPRELGPELVHDARTVRWQVFGLAGLAAVSDYHWPPTCHRFPG